MDSLNEENLSSQTILDPDGFRPLDAVGDPDPRNQLWATVDLIAGTSKPFTLSDHHRAIAQEVLNEKVPRDVHVQFETVRNLYLYAWFAYRFYPVAEHQSLSCLELALRIRLEKDIQLGNVARGRRPMLQAMLGYAVDKGVIKNEGFERWRNRGETNARARVQFEKMREMVKCDIPEIAWDEAEVQVTEQDLEWDFVQVLVKTLPKIRNEHAHGSTELHFQVLNTIQIVRETINQLF